MRNIDAVTPGELLKEEFLKPMGISQYRLAKENGLDNPESIQPSLHYWHSRHLSWVGFADNLPRHSEFPPFSGSES